MFSSQSNHQDSSLFKKAAAAYLTYKALPFGSSRKKNESNTTLKAIGGMLALKAVPKLVKWMGGGALLAYGLKQGYSWYNQRSLSSRGHSDF